MDKPARLTLKEWKRHRRESREERRNAQRVENVERAKAMHHERLAFDRERVAARVENEQQVQPSKMFVGCSGWYYWHWKDMFYPPTIARNRWFDHYAGNFRTVELNAPFYSWPTSGTVRQWLRQAEGKKFVYTVKVCELITHIKRFTGTKQLVKDFGLVADLLGPRMGCFLFQLPPSFHYTAARLRRIVEQLDPIRRTSSNLGIRVGGIRPSIELFEKQRFASVPAAALVYRTPSLNLRTTSTSVFTVRRNGIATITPAMNYRSGQIVFAPAVRSDSGSISTTIVMPMRSRTPRPCSNYCGDE